MKQSKALGWFDPRSWPFTVKLSLTIILLVLVTVTGVTIVSVTTIRAALAHSEAVVEDQVVRNIVVASLVIAGVGGLTALGMILVITRSLVRLSTAAAPLGASNLKAARPPVQVDGGSRLTMSVEGLIAQLRKRIGNLEQRVAGRDQRLETIASLSEYLTGILDFDQFLLELVKRVKESFDYYHIQVYLIDHDRQRLVMVAGAGEVGTQMKVDGHSIPLNTPTSLVARVARTGEIVMIDNVREAKDWLPNPLLPLTQSEMAVPIFLDGQSVGVLDVQKDRVAGLDDGDTSLLRSLANQVALAIRNARLFADVEATRAEAQELQRRYTTQAWDQANVTRHGTGRGKFSADKSTLLDEAAIAEARLQAFANAEPAYITLPDRRNDQIPDQQSEQSGFGDEAQTSGSPGVAGNAWVAPITWHDVAIGNLQLHEVDPTKKWSENELALIEAVIAQVTQTAENLRLIDEAQEQASLERLIGQINAKLRRAPDVESLMKIGVEEVSRALKSRRTFVQLGSTDQSETAPSFTLNDPPKDIPAQPDESPTIVAEIEEAQNRQVSRNGQRDE